MWIGLLLQFSTFAFKVLWKTMIGFPLLLCYFCLKRKKSGTTPDCQGKNCVVLCLLVLTTIFRCQTLPSVFRFVR
jgi:hypothetical protein